MHKQITLFGECVDLPKKKKHTTLASRFIAPPFSILDTKQGYWKSRKNLWLNLGIKGEIGRNLNVGGNHRKDYGTNSATGGYSPTFGKTKDTAVSIFDPVLCEIVYTWFCPKNGRILDPFAGGSVRGIVASKLDYHYTGIELNSQQVNANQQQAKKITPENKPNWIVGDSKNIETLVYNQFDFVFSCPPYYDLEVYSDNENDLSNMSSYTSDFLPAYETIIKKSVNTLKQDSFACFVVGDIRDKKGNYRGLICDTIRAFCKAGAMLYNHAILLTPIGSLPIRVAKQFNAGRKLGKAHQDVLVFVKGCGKKAAQKCAIL